MFCAGGLGAWSRYGLTLVMNRLAGGRFPLGTLAANLLGCFLFGLFWELLGARLADPGPARLVVLAGFMGSFTTFSSWIFDSFTLGQSRPDLALLNILGQVAAGFLFLFLGLTLARLVTPAG
jgi:CrcB protein